MQDILVLPDPLAIRIHPSCSLNLWDMTCDAFAWGLFSITKDYVPDILAVQNTFGHDVNSALQNVNVPTTKPETDMLRTSPALHPEIRVSRTLSLGKFTGF